MVEACLVPLRECTGPEQVWAEQVDSKVHKSAAAVRRGRARCTSSPHLQPDLRALAHASLGECCIHALHKGGELVLNPFQGLLVRTMGSGLWQIIQRAGGGEGASRR